MRDKINLKPVSEPFAKAFHDYQFGEMDGPLLYRRGDRSKEADIDVYFDVFDGEGSWLASQLDGPLLDMGAGAGRHALYFQDQFETVAIEKTETLVEVLHARGVTDARCANMFNLPDVFDENRFQSAIGLGTQASLSRSRRGLTRFLKDLGYVTTDGATAVIDGYDPDHERTKEILDYYEDPSDGLAYRLLQMEYRGTLGDIWLYRLFTPERVSEAAAGTEWTVTDVRYPTENLYQLVLQKD